MSRNGWFVVGFLMGTCSIAAGTASAQRSGAGTTMDVCPNDYLAFAEDSAPLTCGCSVDAVKNGSLYGPNPYAAISAICRAALHAGAVGAKGGQVVITPAPKTPMFPGVTRNGISSNDNSRAGLGFRIAAAGGGAAAAPSNAAIVVAASGTTMEVCPNDYLAFAEDSAPLTCGCSVDAVKNGSLYGANPYTAISAICRAALHAGAVGAKGGQVVITPAPKTPMFPGVTRNGISSNDNSRAGLGFRIAAAGGGAAAAPSNAAIVVAASGTTMEVCPNDYLAFAEDSAPLTCGCSVDAVKNGSLYGANPYTAISAICRAALHAGAVGAKGGQVVITPAPKTPMFPGVTRNGISSNDNSRAGLGFRIAAAGGGAAAAPSNAAIVVAASGTTMEVCPNDYLAFAEDSAPLTCGCSVDAVKNGSLYGANPYTAISAICRAALHAGAVGAKGGQVVITPAPKTPMFPGVTRNGISSNDNSRAGLGFRIAAAGGGAAAAPSNAAIVVAASGTTMEVCPNDYLAFAEDSAPLTCGCSVDAVKNGSLYGANPYTAISAICRAALQAGAVGAKGGQAVITPAPKTPMFPGVTRNGISSNDDRRTGLGFHVAAAGGGAAAAPSNAAIVVAASGTTMDVCPNDYLAFADDSAPLTCGCSVDAVKNGSLYVANPYSAISAICRAALQAGAVGAKGGQAVITPAPKTPMFPGVTRN